MPFQRGPVVKAQLPRNQILGLGEFWGRPETRKRLTLAGACGFEQFLGALTLLFEIKTKLGIGSERVGHNRFPYRLPAFAQADKGEAETLTRRSSVVGAALSANVDAPTELGHVGLFRPKWSSVRSGNNRRSSKTRSAGREVARRRGGFSFPRRANGIMSAEKGCIIVGRPMKKAGESKNNGRVFNVCSRPEHFASW